MPRYRDEPARYGFHATLKAPFELAVGAECADLLHAAHGFTSRQRPIVRSHLAVSRMGEFVLMHADNVEAMDSSSI